ncbi:PREDICTED: uncharacterized protein LOC108579457 [Habropoda laboriosa]|uniref:uncharacterized protein LOC108579457 n=1 Tax=Habropoda laboriosa TaxID=597456 RepID=UPI00083CB784|nr:PREDICTED: uncharacterized protein LOC108579457 [Habropoda laboriosa]
MIQTESALDGYVYLFHIAKPSRVTGTNAGRSGEIEKDPRLIERKQRQIKHRVTEGVNYGLLVQTHPRFPPLDPQETKIRGELYVENLGERSIVSIRMGWLWVEGTTPMSLPLRALNLRQAAPSLCQPHALALGFTLSNSQNHILATFWADTEPIYWSWVRAIAAELVRQTPFRAQRCLNFLEILTICPRGPVPLPDSPTESRRRSRSELRCWTSGSPSEKDSRTTTTILEESRRRARSELRGWSSSNSSDEDLLGDFRSIPAIITKDQPLTRTWGCSESSEGSDDSLPWGGVCRSSVDSVDSTVSIPEPETREQRIQRYKEVRRRENEARSRRVLEEDARRRKARAEENNNDILKTYGSSRSRSRFYSGNDNDDYCLTPAKKDRDTAYDSPRLKNEKNVNSRLPPVKPNETSSVRFEDDQRNEDDKRNNNSPKNGNASPGILRADVTERRSRTRERRSTRDKGQLVQAQQITNTTVETLQERKERLAQLSSRIPVSRQLSQTSKIVENCNSSVLPRSSTSLSVLTEPPCEEDVARLLERCQRVDHYVPVREKLTLFESLSRLGGRLARSTEDLGRTSAKPCPRGKQRARSLHDLNRGARAVPVREMCRFFEGDLEQETSQKNSTLGKTRFSDPVTPTRCNSTWKDSGGGKGNEAPCVRSSTRKKHYLK